MFTHIFIPVCGYHRQLQYPWSLQPRRLLLLITLHNDPLHNTLLGFVACDLPLSLSPFLVFHCDRRMKCNGGGQCESKAALCLRNHD